MKPALNETVPASRSTLTSGGIAASVISSPESVMSVNEWREPSTRTVSACAMISCNSPTLVGR